MPLLTACPANDLRLPPIAAPSAPVIVKVPVIPAFNLDLVPCGKIGGGSLETDLDAVIKGKRAQVRADCNANKLEAAQKALDSAVTNAQPKEPNP
jgi:hypothetical protein